MLVIFVLSEDVIHAPRRAAELGWDAQARGALGEAEALFGAAVEMDAADHELHYGLASTLSMQGRPREARASLLAGLQQYGLSPKLHVALGSLLLKAGRPRAALRRFERTLALSPDPSDAEAREAAVYAGLCGVRLAQSNPSLAAQLLPPAERRLKGALREGPGDKASGIEGLLREAAVLRERLL